MIALSTSICAKHPHVSMTVLVKILDSTTSVIAGVGSLDMIAQLISMNVTAHPVRLWDAVRIWTMDIAAIVK